MLDQRNHNIRPLQCLVQSDQLHLSLTLQPSRQRFNMRLDDKNFAQITLAQRLNDLYCRAQSQIIDVRLKAKAKTIRNCINKQCFC